MNTLHDALQASIHLLWNHGHTSDLVMTVTSALYQAVSETDPTLPTAPGTPTHISPEAFWRAQTDFTPLTFAADWNNTRRPELPTAPLLERMRAAILDFTAAQGSEGVCLAAGAALTDLIDQQATSASGLIPTPATVAALCAELLDVHEGMQVLDPAGGVGRSVIAIMHDLRQRGLNPDTVQFDLQEVSDSAAALAQLHLLLNGVTTARVWRADTLTKPHFELSHYDRVVCDPPFGMKLGHLHLGANDARFHDIDIERFRTRSEWLFLLSAYAALKPGGLAVVITAQGPLFRSGVEEELRKTLSRRGALEAVVALPSALYAAAAIPLALLKLRRPVPGERPRTGIRLVDASGDATRVARQQTLPKPARAALLRDLQLDTTLTGRATTLTPEALTESGNWLPATHLPLPKREYALPPDYDQQLLTVQKSLAQAAEETEAAFGQLAAFART